MTGTVGDCEDLGIPDIAFIDIFYQARTHDQGPSVKRECLMMIERHPTAVRVGVSFKGFIPTGQAIAPRTARRRRGSAQPLDDREASAICMAFAVKAPRAMLVPTA
jgi:hypothetical protein